MNQNLFKKIIQLKYNTLNNIKSKPDLKNIKKWNLEQIQMKCSQSKLSQTKPDQIKLYHTILY